MITQAQIENAETLYWSINQIVDEHEAQTHGATFGKKAEVMLNLLDMIFNLAHEAPGEEENTQYALACLVARNIIKSIEPGSDDA